MAMTQVSCGWPPPLDMVDFDLWVSASSPMCWWAPGFPVGSPSHPAQHDPQPPDHVEALASDDLALQGHHNLAKFLIDGCTCL